MGRTVVGDENQLEAQVDAIIRSGKPAQVGLLVGKLGSAGSRDIVLALVPTPMNEDDVPPTLGVSASNEPSRKGVDSMQLSAEWVGEHARQVSRMLCGGMSVIGVYAFCTEGIYKSSQAILWQAVMTVAALGTPSLDGGDMSEYLLLHISSSPRRFSCRSCQKGSNFSTTALRPCEWKLGKLLNNLQEFSCTYNVDISYPVKIDGTEAANNKIRENLLAAISYEADRLQTARAVVDGSLAEPEKLLGPGSTVHTVDLLLPIDGGANVQPSGGDAKIVGKVIYKGEVHARSYGIVREPISRAIAGLKEDIVASLRSRLELLIDEAEQAAGDAQYENTDSMQEVTADSLLMRHLSSDIPEQSLVMPRRVFVPWVDGAMISDYMLPDENLQDVQEHLTDLFGVEKKLDPSEIIEPETAGIVSMKVVTPSEVRNKDTSQSVATEPMRPLSPARSTAPLTYIGAALVLLIAMLLSIFFLSR
ncbi:unnamed protein product [Calypogeia fissa]